MFSKDEVRMGMTVFSSDGAKLGKVVATGADGFEIASGFFFPKDYTASYGDIASNRGGDLYLSRDAAWLRSDRTAASATAGASYERKGILEKAKDIREEKRADADGDVTMPLMAEELEIRKRPVSKGEVALHKKVEVETRTVDVPLRREVVHVERVKSAVSKPGDGYHAFEDQTITVPITGEEVELVKKAVVTGEVRLHKGAIEEKRHLSENLRHEEVEFLRKGDLGEDQLSIDKLEGEAPILSKSKDLGDSSLRH
jgi:uncharacterized protein (TIGR02271 family)